MHEFLGTKVFPFYSTSSPICMIFHIYYICLNMNVVMSTLLLFTVSWELRAPHIHMYVVVYLCCSFCMVRVMTKIYYPLIFSQSALNLSFMYKLVRSTNVNMLGAQHSAPIEDHCVLIIAHSIHVWIMYSANKLQTSNCWFKWAFFRMYLFGGSDFSGKKTLLQKSQTHQIEHISNG